jgi:hypothetical protein
VNTLLEYLKARPFVGPFKPVPRFNGAFRCWEWYWKDERAYEEPIHHDGAWVGSVMRSMETNEVVGVKVFVP